MELLVARLEDDDDAVRFFAILALDRMTGTRLGYSYHGPLDQRTRAVQAWHRYLAQQTDDPKPDADLPVAHAQPASGSGAAAGGHP